MPFTEIQNIHLAPVSVFTACPINTYQSTAGKCEACPSHSHTQRNGSIRSDCMCNRGFTGAPGGPCSGNQQSSHCGDNSFRYNIKINKSGPYNMNKFLISIVIIT